MKFGRLHDQRIAVVGGSSGIGLAIATAVQAESAFPVIGSRNNDKRAAALNTLCRAPAKALYVDATDAAAIDSFFEAAGRLDHLVISVSGPESEPSLFADSLIEHGRQHFEQTYWTARGLSHAFIRKAQRTPRCSILLVTGGLSRRPLPGKSIYTASQWAIEGFAKALVSEVAPLRVNVLVPGLVKSPRWSFLGAVEHEKMFANAAAETPVGFIAEPHAIASAAVEILSNAYINGASIVVDGGWTAV